MLIDDVPHYSCSVLTHTVRGRKVTTIEGLAAADGTLHPVQQAVVDEQGFQCAFCMSGFVMSAVGFLKTESRPRRGTELAHGISGNLCRCQDYSKILDSMMRGAEYMRHGIPAARHAPDRAKRGGRSHGRKRRDGCAMKAESEKPRPFGTGYKLIGKDYSTTDLVAKVTGRAKYAEDFRAEGMLFCRLVLSPMPHARVKSIDAEKALAMPGVKAILTPSDVPGHAAYMNDNGTMIKADKWGELALADEPMYQGEPILAVAAVDELTCAEAIEKIEIEMEPLPFATDPLESLRPGGSNAREDGNVWVRPSRAAGRRSSPRLKWTDEDFRRKKRAACPWAMRPTNGRYGDVDAGFKNAALVLDETFITPDVSHQCLEPRTTMAYWQNGKLFLYTGTQSTLQTVAAIARWMHMDEDKIVFISEYTGGGFGSKITGALTLVIPALLSKKAECAGDDAHQPRGGALYRARAARDQGAHEGGFCEGRPHHGGGYVSGFATPDRTARTGDGGSCGSIASLLYQPPAMRWRNVTVVTNTPPRSAQSAPGGMQAIAIMEPILAKAARKLGVDQVALRRVNCPEGKAQYGPPNHEGKRAIRHKLLPQAGAGSRAPSSSSGRSAWRDSRSRSAPRCAAWAWR